VGSARLQCGAVAGGVKCVRLPNMRVERAGAVGQAYEWLEGIVSTSLTRRIAWTAVAPAAHAQVRYAATLPAAEVGAIFLS
jgi:hypothetical protein